MNGWTVVLTGPAGHDFRRLDPVVARHVRDGLHRLAATGQGDVKKVKAAGDEFRLRVGEWRARLTFDYDKHIITVHSIRPRGRAYRD